MVRWKWHRGHPADAEKRTSEYRAPRNQGPREAGAPGAPPAGPFPAAAGAGRRFRHAAAVVREAPWAVGTAVAVAAAGWWRGRIRPTAVSGCTPPEVK